MKDDFIVPLDGLAQGRTEFRRCVGKEFFESFENSEIIDACADVLISIDKSRSSIKVDCDVDGSVTVICDRCLEDLQIPVSTGFSLDVRFGEQASSGEEISEDGREVVYVKRDSAVLDLSQDVYDYICLSLPVQRVHEDGACNPEAIGYLNSQDDGEPDSKDSSTPFAGLKDLLEKMNDK